MELHIAFHKQVHKEVTQIISAVITLSISIWISKRISFESLLGSLQPITKRLAYLPILYYE